ncbi:MAG: hypothetical protein Q8N93_01695, partial [Bacillota bacterium]|nr:hypothetical protein [Bacillota bacterium]
LTCFCKSTCRCAGTITVSTTAAQLIDIAADALAFGLLRLEHMHALKTDPGYRILKHNDRLHQPGSALAPAG